MPPKSKFPFLTGLFLICMCGLMLQIIETRVLSVISYYYLAFFAIAMAMFGMTAGSLFVYFRETLFPRHKLFENLIWISSAFAISVVVSAVVAITTVLTGFSRKTELLMTAVQWGKLVFILATPYVFAGMAISLALTRSPWPVPLVYGVDLVGAATGCLVVLAVLSLIDSVSAWVLVGALGALAAVFFSQACRAGSGGGATVDKRARPGSRTATDACCGVRRPRISKRRNPAVWLEALNGEGAARGRGERPGHSLEFVLAHRRWPN